VAGWGKDNIVAKLGKRMFLLFIQEELVVKLPRARVEQVILEGKGSPFDPRRNGRVMKEWVVFAKNSTDWGAFAREALNFARKGSEKADM
jgi:hypothetical protein